MVGVVLSLLILSVALSIYTTEVQYQEFQRNKYNSAILNFSDDFNRVLTGILAGATKSYNNNCRYNYSKSLSDDEFYKLGCCSGKCLYSLRVAEQPEFNLFL